MILLWMIIDQIRWEKICKKNGWEPAVTMKERLYAYCICVLLPIALGILMR